MPKLRDLTNRRFGMLVVVRIAYRRNRIIHWECKCDCGKMSTPSGRNLVRGLTKSCGCNKYGHNNLRHGLSNTAEYRAWKSMKGRCCNPLDKRYHRYGGRGICLAPEWLDDFEAFLSDVGPRPSPKHSIDRIDNDGHYEPGNVKWSTPVEQNRNRSTNKVLEVFGLRKTAAEWALEIGISTQHLIARLRNGWAVEDAVSLGLGTKKPPPGRGF